MANSPNDVASNLVQRLVDRAINEAHYLCCFKSYVEDFEKEKERLSAKIKSVDEDIEAARQRNKTRIDPEIQQWLKEAESLIKEDTKAKKKWLFGLCTNCIWQYGRGKDLFQKKQEILELIERKKDIVQVARSAGPVGIKFHCLLNFMPFESRKKEFEELIKALTDSHNRIVGLHGMGGTGKTTMAAQVGKEVEESKFFDKVIFTVVSNPPNVEKIRSDIAKQLVSQSADTESLWSRISNGGEKILIILDDVWEKELDLKHIGIPVGLHDKGHCSVFLTTRDLKVLKAMGCDKTIQLDVLLDEEALNLFLSHAIKPGVDSSGGFKDVALDIVKWCGGLPVAIEAIAKSIKSESLQVWKDTSRALQKFGPMLNDVEEAMKKPYNCLKLSYDYLKNEKAQKLFLLCSLFPQDFEIPVELLSRIAIGLGLCGEVDEYNSARTQVIDDKSKLVDSSLLLEDEENVKMHDLVHEVATKIANKEIQVVRNSKTTLKENVRFSSWIDGFHSFNGSKLILIIFITTFVEFPDSLFEGMTKLRVLVIDSDGWVMRRSFWVKSVQSLVNIRTLRLAYLKLEDISSMGNLQSLETVELFDCSIVELPNEITKLENLRLLGLSGCDIERNNPFEVIERCSRLQELYYRYNSDIRRQLDDKVVRGIGIPRTLQMYDIIGKGRTFWWVEKKASLLRRLVPTYFQNIFSEAAFKFLAAKAEILELDGDYGTGWTNLIPHIAPIEDGGMNDLMELSLQSFPKMECLIHTKNIGSEVTIFAKLVELKLSTVSVKELCCGPFPNGFLKKLEKLHLYGCSNLEGTLFKGKLDLGKLKCIELEYCCSMSSLFHPSTAQSLNQLEKLEIIRCDELKNIITIEGLGVDKVEDDPADPNEMCHGSIFSKLKFAEVQFCDKLEFILPISFVEDLPLLEEVNICDCEKLKHIFGQHQHEGFSYQKGKEIKLPSLKEMNIWRVPNFINIFPAECCHHPMSPVMKKLSTTKDDLKVKDPSLSCTFSWALICCKSTATSIDNPIVSEEALQNCTGLQATKTELVLDRVQCLLRPPLNPHNMREMTIADCPNITSLFTIPIASSMLLEKLEVNKCRGLKHLITDKGDGHDHINKISILPKLKMVSIENCRLLESLFPASHCTTFDDLKSLKISRAHKLRYVFEKCYCEDNLAHKNQNVEIRLPTLEKLLIHDVPNMVNICGENSYMTTLSLKKFVLIECPQLPVRPLSDFKVGLHETQEDLASRKVLEIQPESLTFLYLKNVKIRTIYDLQRPQIKGPMISILELMWLKNLPELRYICEGLNILSLQNLSQLKISGCKKLEVIFSASISRSLPLLKELFVSNCKSLKCLFSISTCGVLPNLANKQGETKEMVMEDVLPKLETLKLVSLPSLDCICQGIDFQTVPKRFVHDCPNISLTSTITISDDDKDDKYALEIPFLETSSEDEEILGDQDDEIKATSEEVAFQSKKEAKKAVVDEDLEIQEENNNTQNITESTKEAANEAFNQVPTFDIPATSASSSNSIPQQKPSLIQERKETGDQEGPKLENATIENEIMDSEELSKASPAPLSIPLQNESPEDNLVYNEPRKETIIMEQAATVETRTDMHFNDSQNITEVSVGEGPSSEKNINPTSTTHSEPMISHPEPLTSTKEVNEKKPRGDREALDESLSTKEPPGRLDRLANEVSSKEGSNKTTLEDTSPVISSVSRSKKPQAVTEPTEIELGGSKSNQEDISCNTESPQGQITVKQLNEIDIDEEIKVEHTKVEKFDEDDLTRLFRIMEEDTDMGVGMPYIPNIAAIEDDNKVAKAFADLEASLKMDLNEIASSEEDSLRLQNALNFMSSHCSEEDGAPSHGISGTIDSLHQEIQSIISCFKQSSSTVNNFTELEGKEKHMINEELPQRKKAANTLNSEIDKTEKSMAELKEHILRLQAELNRKEKEFKECEIKLSCLQEQKKKSVWENMGFMKEFVDVKKDRSHMEEEQIKARQDLEKSKIKWSSCVANLKKTTMLLGIYLKQKI